MEECLKCKFSTMEIEDARKELYSLFCIKKGDWCYDKEPCEEYEEVKT